MAAAHKPSEAEKPSRFINREVVLASHPKGWVNEGNFAIQESEFVVAHLRQGSKDVSAKVLWVSLDPYLRELMNETRGALNMPVFEIGKAIQAYTLSKVLDSDHPDFKEGDIVYGVTDVAEYIVVAGGEGLEKVDATKVPMTYYLGVLGMPGHTAWVGVNVIAQVKPKEEVYVTAAAGAVGHVAGQFAKLKGCRVVGSAGSDEKVKGLKEEIKFDDAFNYKVEQDWDGALKKRFPKGIDVYYENVGGHMLQVVLDNINLKGRIAACGMVSQYNKEPHEWDGIRNLFNIVGKCVRMEGFVIFHYRHTRQTFLAEVIPLLQEGKIKYKEHVLGGSIYDFPKAFIEMLKGKNIGKSILRVSSD